MVSIVSDYKLNKDMERYLIIIPYKFRKTLLTNLCYFGCNKNLKYCKINTGYITLTLTRGKFNKYVNFTYYDRKHRFYYNRITRLNNLINFLYKLSKK